ncbi:hypothetical protein N7539_007930 [Penicillium diatomitis]|uniref:Uncharacterized protein n=1 Tax=Penicillium diatomitis TaxID=2819901 RepID=A0A9W9WUQ2_9EURO|nr:uncharacterized protein N7539_007930 [Penicillium diatomitis]KAJ5475643.1 hypothetical protein N7539_007930 [Penicillium diatomitis]
MNWTGGQLHRHLTRPGNLSQAQKQHFFQSRQQSSGNIRLDQDRLKIGQDIDDSQPGDTVTHDLHDPERGGTEEVINGKSSLPTRSTDPPFTERHDHLERLKRRLLEDTDWAVVSAARPLQIKFTVDREIDRFGKRRRLNDTDRQRMLDANTGQGHSTLFTTTGRPSRARAKSPDPIRIRITKPPFDPNTQLGDGNRRKVNDVGARRCPDTWDTSESNSPARARNKRYSSADQNMHRSAGSTTQLNPSLPSPLQDSMILWAKPRYSKSRQPHRALSDVSCAPTEILPVSSTLMPSDSLSSVNVQSWLPHPVRRKSFSGHVAMHASDLESSSHFPPCFEPHYTPDFQFPELAQVQPSVPVEIFGQLVRNRSISISDTSRC